MSHPVSLNLSFLVHKIQITPAALKGTGENVGYSGVHETGAWERCLVTTRPGGTHTRVLETI